MIFNSKYTRALTFQNFSPGLGRVACAAGGACARAGVHARPPAVHAGLLHGSIQLYTCICMTHTHIRIERGGGGERERKRERREREREREKYMYVGGWVCRCVRQCLCVCTPTQTHAHTHTHIHTHTVGRGGADLDRRHAVVRGLGRNAGFGRGQVKKMKIKIGTLLFVDWDAMLALDERM